MNNLIVEPAPHIRGTNSTRIIMLHVIIALIPTFVASCIIFGPRAGFVTAVSVSSCVIFEFLFNLVLKKQQTAGDFSAIVTGIILGFNLPVTLPFYMVIIGAFVAIVVVKQMFGGLGQNFANPAATARIVLVLSFTPEMSHWVKPFFYLSGVKSLDGITAATPLTAQTLPTLREMFLGIRGGSLGETCAAALIIGFIYLVVTRVIHPVTPLVFIGTVALGTLIFGGSGRDVIYTVLSGGLLLGAIFMATDYSTSPITPFGKLIFAVGCGVITLLIRRFGALPGGVSFAILIMNILTPYIDMLTRPKPFGMKNPAKSGKEGKA